jgi:hypothetical protein
VNFKEETNINEDLRDASQKPSPYALTSYGGQAGGKASNFRVRTEIIGFVQK